MSETEQRITTKAAENEREKITQPLRKPKVSKLGEEENTTLDEREEGDKALNFTSTNRVRKRLKRSRIPDTDAGALYKSPSINNTIEIGILRHHKKITIRSGKSHQMFIFINAKKLRFRFCVFTPPHETLLVASMRETPQETERAKGRGKEKTTRKRSFNFYFIVGLKYTSRKEMDVK